MMPLCILRVFCVELAIETVVQGIALAIGIEPGVQALTHNRRLRGPFPPGA